MKVKHILFAAVCCTATLSAQAQAKTFTRNKVLVEKHTGLACPNCPDGDRLFNGYLERCPQYKDKVVEMRHNSYAPFDRYFQSFHRELSDLWRVDGWPRYYMDRCHYNGWKFSDPIDYGINRGIFSNEETDEIGLRLAKLTNVSLSLSGSTYNPSTKTLNVRVSGEVTASLPDLHINIFLLQDDDSYEGTSCAYLTRSLHGDWLPVSAGRYDVLYTMTIEDQYRSVKTNPDRMRVVAFVSSFDDKDFTNSEVHNCDVVSLSSLSAAPPRPRQQCASPSIELQGQQLVMKSATPGAAYFYSLTSDATADLTTASAADLAKATFTVTAYAGAPGYTDSPEVTKTFSILDLIGDKKDVNGDGKVTVTDLPALINLMKK